MPSIGTILPVSFVALSSCWMTLGVSDEPTAASNSSVEWDWDNTQAYEVQFWDTAGQEALSQLRAVAYPDTDLFLLAYDMTR